MWRQRLTEFTRASTRTAVMRMLAQVPELVVAKPTADDGWDVHCIRFGVLAGAVDQLWYFRSVSVTVGQRLPGLLSDELRVTVREMERLTGWSSQAMVGSTDVWRVAYNQPRPTLVDAVLDGLEGAALARLYASEVHASELVPGELESEIGRAHV